MTKYDVDLGAYEVYLFIVCFFYREKRQLSSALADVFF